MKQVVAVTVSVTVFFMGLPPLHARRSSAPAREVAAAEPAEPAARVATVLSHRLRDAVPAASFVVTEPDTAEEDDFLLPEETDNKKLIRDIAVFVIVAAFVAYFIIKVFIEEDEEPPPPDDGGKPIPTPE